MKKDETISGSASVPFTSGDQRAEIAAPISWGRAHDSLGWLGAIREIHAIGVFTIVEFLEKKGGKLGFAGFIGDDDLHEYWDSLDEAILGCLINKYNERNAAMHITPFVAKMIGVQS